MSTTRKPHPIESLSFVYDRAPKSRTNVQRCLWHVQPTGNYDGDCHTGQLFAIEYLRYRVECEESTPLLALIIRDMPKGGEHTGIEVGFLELLDIAAHGGHHHAEQTFGAGARVNTAPLSTSGQTALW